MQCGHFKGCLFWGQKVLDGTNALTGLLLEGEEAEGRERSQTSSQICGSKAFWYVLRNLFDMRIKYLLQRLVDIKGSDICSWIQGSNVNNRLLSRPGLTVLHLFWYLDHLFVCSKCCLLVFSFVWSHLLVLHFFVLVSKGGVVQYMGGAYYRWSCAL